MKSQIYIDSGYSVDVIYLNFQKALDKVPRRRLISGLWFINKWLISGLVGCGIYWQRKGLVVKWLVKYKRMKSADCKDDFTAIYVSCFG